MPSLSLRLALSIGLVALTRLATAQEAASAIEQSRLYQKVPAPITPAVNADGMALGDTTSGDTSDDSLGAQVFLKNQPRIRTFFVSADASAFYTSNVALTRRDHLSDFLVVANTSASWNPHLANNLEAQIGAHVSVFRYERNPALDFGSTGLGAGISWTPPKLPGVAIFARYDLNELLSRGGDELLRDHEFTAGAQKVFVLGRAHALSLGVTGMAGISDPGDSQRDQVGAFLAYHLQLARRFETDLSYRFSYYFYNEGGRIDRNQVAACSVRYHLTDWAEVSAVFTFGDNRSNEKVFTYDVFTAGAGLGVTARF